MVGSEVIPPGMCDAQTTDDPAFDCQGHPHPGVHSFQEHGCIPVQERAEKHRCRVGAAYVRDADRAVTVEQGCQYLGTLQMDLEGRGLFQLLRPVYGQGSQGRVSQPKKPGVRVFDDPPQLVQDQPWLEFQRGGQDVRDLQQRGLLACAGFDTLVEALFRLDALADIPNDAQQTRPVLIGECRPAPLGVKRGAVPAYVQHARVKRSPDRNAWRYLLKTFWLSGWMNAAGSSPMNSARV